MNSINTIEKIATITIGGFEFPLPTAKKKYGILIVGDVHIPIEVTQCYSKILGSMLFRMSLLTRPDQPCQWVPSDEHEMDEVRKHNLLYPLLLSVIQIK